MFKFLVFIIIVFNFYGNNIEVIIYGDENYPPYSYVEDGELKGIYTDIIKEASKRVEGYNIELKSIPWKRGVNFLETGNAFALYPPYFRPSERPWMDYSIPILDEVLVIITSDHIIDAGSDWVSILKTLKIGKNRGFASLSYLEDFGIVKVDKLRIEEASSTRMNLLKLGTGRIDAYINDKISMLWTLKKLKSNGEYRPDYLKLKIWKEISSEYGHIGYTQKNAAGFYYKKDFKDKMDKALGELKETGIIDKIVKNYIGYDFEM